MGDLKRRAYGKGFKVSGASSAKIVEQTTLQLKEASRGRKILDEWLETQSFPRVSQCVGQPTHRHPARRLRGRIRDSANSWPR